VKAVSAPEAEAAARPGLLRRVLIIALVALLLFAGTYAYAWFNASRLSSRFMQDADTAYDNGEYLQALVGSEDFDPETNRYITRGGYIKVEKIWSHRLSWPAPAAVQGARERIHEIVYERLTIAEAEDYIRANTGRPAPYFGEIYLRLGELYEADGDPDSAIEIYASIQELFPNRPDLIEAAQKHLDRLEG
jgi:hypothetical protein